MTAPANPWTPGPWRIAGKGTIRAGEGWIGTINWRNREANAALVAAAPNLYDALSEALSELHDKVHSHMSQEEFEAHPTISAIRAALSKARGETP